MKKIIILLLVSPLLLAFVAHKYYLSVTDLEYNPETKSVQVITRLFYDDIEEVLQERYDDAVIVDATYDQAVIDRYLKKYFAQKLEVNINNEEKKLNFIGKEYEDDYVVCYLEISDVSNIQSIEITNTLLTDVFPEQKNMVHTSIDKRKKSFLLTRENPKGLLNFSE